MGCRKKSNKERPAVCSFVVIVGRICNNFEKNRAFYDKSMKLGRLRAKKGPAPPPPPLGNFVDISYLEENFKPHLLRDVCTLCSGALVSDSLLHMLMLQTKEKIKMKF